MNPKEDLDGSSRRALVRHSAISWIEQCRNSGSCFGECLKRAAELAWGGRFFSPRTLEEWYYAYRQGGFSRLQTPVRSDRGKLRAMDPKLAQAILELRKNQPSLTVTAILERLRSQGIVEPGTTGCSRATVYRLLQKEGLDRLQAWQTSWAVQPRPGKAGCPMTCGWSIVWTAPPENWQALFYERFSRRVRLDATVSIEGRWWEVPVHLRGRLIELRRDLFDKTQIEVWCQGVLCGRATPCDKQLNNNRFTSNNYER